MVTTRSSRPEGKEETNTASTGPQGVNLNAIFEAEAEFLASRERTQLGDGTQMPARSTEGWYIPAVEGGPPPYRTREDFMAAQDKWEEKIDNDARVRIQLFKFSVIDSHNEPLFDNKKHVPKKSQAYTRIQKLIENYKHELEPEHWELDNIKHIPNYKPKPNRFAEFMAQRKQILNRSGRADDADSDFDSDELDSETEELLPNKKAAKKRQSSGDDDFVERTAKSSKKRKSNTLDSAAFDEQTDEEPTQEVAKVQYMTKFSRNTVRLLNLKPSTR